MRMLLCLILFVFPTFGYSQDLNAYQDYRDYFYIYDDGEEREFEQFPVRSLSIGDKCVAYIDHKNHLKVYYDGVMHDLSNVQENFILTDNLMVYKYDDQLFVFDHGQRTLLSILTSRFAVGDNMVAFYDKREERLKAYYDGTIYELEDALVNMPIHNFKVSEDIIAFINNHNYLKVFYEGEVNEVTYYAGKIKYAVGGDLLAYVDYSMNTFYVYDEGELIPLEYFEPMSFAMGDGFIVYTDHTGTFKYYSNKSKVTIASYEPDFYKVKDDIVLYSDQGYFKVYYQHQIYTLEKYIPSSYQIDHKAVAYEDVNGRLQLFYEGKEKTVSYEDVTEFRLAGNTLYYKLGQHNVRIFSMKKD